MSNIFEHPAARLMAEVKAESNVAESDEARALQNTIFKAVFAYYQYLDRNGLFYDGERDLLRASALVVTCDSTGDMEITLKDGAKDRRFGGGADPDPQERDLNPV